MFLKKIPQRTCLGCMQSKNKSELVRIVKQNDGKTLVKFNVDLEKNFETKIDNEIYESLRGVIVDK